MITVTDPNKVGPGRTRFYLIDTDSLHEVEVNLTHPIDGSIKGDMFKDNKMVAMTRSGSGSDILTRFEILPNAYFERFDSDTDACLNYPRLYRMTSGGHEIAFTVLAPLSPTRVHRSCDGGATYLVPPQFNTSFGDEKENGNRGRIEDVALITNSSVIINSHNTVLAIPLDVNITRNESFLVNAHDFDEMMKQIERSSSSAINAAVDRYG